MKIKHGIKKCKAQVSAVLLKTVMSGMDSSKKQKAPGLSHSVLNVKC